MNFMKINIFLGLIINMIVIVYLLMVTEIVVVVVFDLDLNNHMVVVLVSTLLFLSQVIWIKNEEKGWIKMMDKCFGVKISTD